MLNGGGGGVISTVPINTTADMQDVILRMWGGSMADLVAKVGFEVAFLPMGEIYMALTLGTVDAAMTSWAGLYGLKAHEAAKYIVQPDIVPPTADHITINLDVWNDLPADLQQQLYGGAHDWREIHYNYTYSQRAGSINAMVAEGAEITMLTEGAQSEIREAAFEVWDDVAAVSDDCAKGVQIVKDYWNWVNAGSTDIEAITKASMQTLP
jgi:TRAP-type C4-dicarboxylate transport system substrate-binding protein